MENPTVEQLEARMAEVAALPLEQRAEALGAIHDELRTLLESPESR